MRDIARLAHAFSTKHGVKKNAEFISHNKYFSNFAPDKYGDKGIGL